MNEQLNHDLRASVNRELSKRIADHLTKQKAQSLYEGESGCAYRGAEGRMCAVGCLIPDEKYSTDMEECVLDEGTAGGGMVMKALVEENGGYTDMKMLREWQRYHDSSMDQGYGAWCRAQEAGAPDNGTATSPAQFHEHMMEKYGYGN